MIERVRRVQRGAEGGRARHSCSIAFATLALLLLGAGTVGAQEPALSRELLLFREVPTVITAAGREQPLTQAPAAVTVITAEEIQRSGATTIPDLLRAVPGLDFARLAATDVSIAARGLNDFSVTVLQLLIDGRPVSEDFVGVVPWHRLPISLEEIERIEIVKSPASALYGDRAFGGVVHIITKSPEALKGTSVSVTGGDFGTALGSLIHADVVGPLKYKISLGYDRTNHFPNPLFGISNDDKGRENFLGNFLVSYRLAPDSDLSLSGGITLFEKQEAVFAGRSTGKGGFGFIQAGYTLGDFKAQYVFNRFDSKGRARLDERTSVLADAHQLDLRHSVELGKHILTGGLRYRFNAFDSTFLIGRRHDQHLFGVFLQDEYRLLDDLTATVGVRLDTHPEAGTTVSPRGSLVYTPWANHTVRASVGVGFRNPTIFENFAALDLATGLPPPAPATVRLIGNRDLDPMKLVSYELGYQTFLFDRVRATIDLFYYQFDPSIEVRPVDPSDPTLLTLVNTKAFSTIGGEPGLEVLIAEGLKGFVNYSYQDRKIKEPEVPGIAPRHKANLGLTLSIPTRFSATLLVHYVGEAVGASGRVDPYTLVNLRLGQGFKLWGQGAEVALQAFNLLNDVHREMPGGDLIERRISGTFRVQF